MLHLRDKIASLMVIGFNGNNLDNSDLSQWLKDASWGGLLFFDYDCNEKKWGKNLYSIEQIKTFIQDINQYHEKHHPQAPGLLMAIDYEGGHVDRLKAITNLPQTSTPKDLAQHSEIEYEESLHVMAQTLSTLGFNLNFAPLVDLEMTREAGIIGKLDRSFGRDPVFVAEKAKRWVEIFSKYHVASSYKHFPGHGSAQGDTHTDFVDVTKTYHADELIPYSYLKELEHCPVMVMTAHVVNKKLDETGLPATLSKTILTTLLKEKLAFSGVIISDDIQMQALASHYDLDELLTLTFNAGADMIILGNQMGYQNPIEIVERIEKLIHLNKISIEHIEAAYARVLKLKSQLNLKKNLNNEAILTIGV